MSMEPEEAERLGVFNLRRGASTRKPRPAPITGRIQCGPVPCDGCGALTPPCPCGGRHVQLCPPDPPRVSAEACPCINRDAAQFSTMALNAEAMARLAQDGPEEAARRLRNIGGR